MGTVVVSSNRGHTVVVNQQRTAATVKPGTVAVRIPDQGTAVGVVRQQTRTVAVAAPGPQGPAGPAGGAVIERTANAALGGHRVVRSIGVALVDYASSDNPVHGDDTLGLTITAAQAGASVDVLRNGAVTFNGWAWSAGEPVFLAVNGGLTQVPPSEGFVQVIGHAESPTTLFLDIQPPMYFD